MIVKIELAVDINEKLVKKHYEGEEMKTKNIITKSIEDSLNMNFPYTSVQVRYIESWVYEE